MLYNHATIPNINIFYIIFDYLSCREKNSVQAELDTNAKFDLKISEKGDFSYVLPMQRYFLPRFFGLEYRPIHKLLFLS